jgi:hypothetical protein
MAPDPARQGETFHHTIYSGQELWDRLEQVGFVDVALYGNLDGDEYGPNAQRLIAVAHKPEAQKSKHGRTTGAWSRCASPSLQRAVHAGAFGNRDRSTE